MARRPGKTKAKRIRQANSIAKDLKRLLQLEACDVRMPKGQDIVYFEMDGVLNATCPIWKSALSEHHLVLKTVIELYMHNIRLAMVEEQARTANGSH